MLVLGVLLCILSVHVKIIKREFLVFVHFKMEN